MLVVTLQQLVLIFRAEDLLPFDHEEVFTAELVAAASTRICQFHQLLEMKKASWLYFT